MNNNDIYRILLVDDETFILDIGKKLLKKLGYESFTALNGENALKILDGQNIDLVIIDVSLKGSIDSKELARQIKEINKEIKLVASSGYFNDPVMLNHEEYNFDGVIRKPYGLTELNQIILSIIQPVTDTL